MTSERPLILPLATLSAGCLLEYLLAVPVSILLPIVAALVLVAAFPCRNRALFCCLLALFWSSWGMAALSDRLDGKQVKAGIAAFDGQQVFVEGLLVRRPEMLPDGQRFELRAEQVIRADTTQTASGTLLVTVARGQGDWLTGDRIRFPARIRVPRRLGLPGEFDYPRYLALRGIVATAWVKHADSVVLMRRTAGPSVTRWIDLAAVKSQRFIRQIVTDPDRHGVVLALATGNQKEIPEELRTAYNRAGVSHILSVSGFHVGVVTFVWVCLVRWLLLRWEWLALRVEPRRVALLTSLPLMLFYLVFTGSAPATARSVLMLSALVIALWSERDVAILDVLLSAAFALLVYDPGLLFDLSFQLSFLALWGLVVLTPLLMAPWKPYLKQGWQYTLVQFCAASCGAVLATLLPVLVYFHQASFTGIVSNLLIVPLLGYGATVLATAAIPLLWVLPEASAFLLKLSGWLVQISNQFVVWIAGFPVLQSFSVDPAALVAMITLLVLLGIIKSVRGRVATGFVICSTLVVLHGGADVTQDGKLRLRFLSVGQGDALLISLPDSRTMLVDGGGYLWENGRDFGERYLVPALHSLKVRQVDIMVLTHPHPDHLGGLPAVAEQFRVKEFWQSPEQGTGADYQRLVRALQQQGTLLRTVKQGDRPLVTAAVEVTVVAPMEKNLSGRQHNDDSLVLRLQQGAFSALLMGDAGFEVEEQLIRQGVGVTTLLKAGHHGSKTAGSERFLKHTQPQLVVISAGFGNSFGLPADETVERIIRSGAQLCRTDLQGTLEVSSDGISFDCKIIPTENRLVSVARRFILTGGEVVR